jgi:hypothetical protein
MRRNKLYNIIIASVLATLLLAGTTGFRMEKHSCSHCGLEYSLSIFPKAASVSESCCGDKEYPVNDSDNCNIGTGSCCSIETSTLKLDESFITSAYFEEIVSPPIFININEPVYGSEFICSFIIRDLPCKYGGRQILTLNSQYRT